MKKVKITNAVIEKAVEGSSRIEGLSLARAKKDKAVIKILKKLGRAFSV